MKAKTITKLKKGDPVIVISGKYKNVEGKIEKILPDNKCIVSGVAIVKKHSRAKKQGEKSQIISKESPISLSKISYCVDGKPVKLGYKNDEKNAKLRINKKTQDFLISKGNKSNG